MLTIPGLLAILALLLAIGNAVNPPKVPLNISVIVLALAVLILLVIGARP